MAFNSDFLSDAIFEVLVDEVNIVKLQYLNIIVKGLFCPADLLADRNLW